MFDQLLLMLYVQYTVEHLPRKYRQLMKWRMSQLTPIVIKSCIARSGFRTTTSKHFVFSHFF